MIRSIFFFVIIHTAFINFSWADGGLPISGSYLVYLKLFMSNKQEIEKQLNMKLDIVRNNSMHGLNDLINGQAKIAMVIFSKEEIDSLMAIKDNENVQVTNFGDEKIYFVASADINVNSLSSENIKAILLGNITNWSEIGGQDIPITIVTESKDAEIRRFLEVKLLDGKYLSGNLKEYKNTPAIGRMMLQNQGVFGFLPESLLNEKLKVIDTDIDLKIPINLVYLNDNDINLIKLIEVTKNILHSN